MAGVIIQSSLQVAAVVQVQAVDVLAPAVRRLPFSHWAFTSSGADARQQVDPENHIGSRLLWARSWAPYEPETPSSRSSQRSGGGAAPPGRCRSCRRCCRSRRRSGTARWCSTRWSPPPASTRLSLGPNLRAHLEAQGRAHGVAGHQRGGDAEALAGLAIPVLDAEHRLDLADEDRGAVRARWASTPAGPGRRRRSRRG